MLTTLSATDILTEVMSMIIAGSPAEAVLEMLPSKVATAGRFRWVRLDYVACSAEDAARSRFVFTTITFSPKAQTIGQSESQDLRILTRPFDFQSLASIRTSSIAGPLILFGEQIAPTETVLFVNCSLPGEFLAMFHICGEHSLESPSAAHAWSEQLRRIFSVSAPVLRARFDEQAHQRRHAYYEHVLTSPEPTLAAAYKTLCAAWLEALGGDWAWLWLYNASQSVQQWELVYSHSREPSIQLPTTRCVGSRQSVLEYAYRTKEPQYVADINDWRRDLDGVSHAPDLAKTLSALGCKSVYVVPLVLPPEVLNSQSTSTGEPPIQLRAGICIHFAKRPNPSMIRSQHSIMLMGRLGGFMLLDCYEIRKRQILQRLNELVAKHLTNDVESPVLARKAYCDDLRKLLQEELHFTYASFFSINEEGDRLVCLATSGVFDRSGKAVSSHSLGKVFYEHGVHWTGQVWASGKPKFTTIDSQEDRFPNHTPTWSETPPGKTTALAIYPVLRTSRRPLSANTPATVAVIRCAGAHVEPSPGISFESNFNTFQLLALDFVARQCGPVLETLNAQIEHHKQICRVKHDLMLPAGTLTTRSEDLTKMLAETALSKKQTLERIRSIRKRLSDALAQQQARGYNPEIRQLLEDTAIALQKDEGYVHNTLLHTTREEFEKWEYVIRNLTQDAYTALKLVGELDAKSNALLSFNPVPTHLEGQIVARLKNGLSPNARDQKNMTIHFMSFVGVVPQLLIDPVLIERALTNVLNNAIKYGDRGTQIDILPQSDENGYYVLVTNQGIPIYPDEREKIFYDDYRSDIARHTAEGQGHGLKITRQIIERHNGWAKAQHENGLTTITLFFPKNLAVTT